MEPFSKTILILIFLHALSLECLAQKSEGQSFSFNYKSGLLLTHREEIPQSIRDKKPYGFDLLLNINTNGTKAWHKYWNNPDYGFSIGFFDLDQKNILGDVYYVTYFFEKSVFNSSGKHDIRYRIAPGLAYSDIVYNMGSNPDNILVSLPVNFIMELSLFYKLGISSSLNMIAGLNLTHYSNGALKFPNIGVNIPNLNIGLCYNFKGIDKQKITAIEFEPEFKKAYEWQIIPAMSWKSAGEEYEDLDFAYSLSLNRIWKLNPRYSWVSGIDLMFNNTIRKVLGNPEANRYRAGLTGGVQYELGRLAFLLQAGVYIYRPEKQLDKAIYQRWGFKHELGNKFLINLMLKTHYARADLIEIGFGLRI